MEMKNSNIQVILRYFTTHITSESEKYKFWNWLVSSVSKEQKKDVLFDIWENADVCADETTYSSLNKVKRKAGITIEKKPFRTNRINWILRVAVVFLPLITILVSLMYVEYYKKDVEMMECSIPYGEKKQLTLPDGTTVTVNAGSYLIYPKQFQRTTRTVFLSGEANFDVYPDKHLPFIVKTAQMSVQALGTKFNVQAYSNLDKSIAILERGSVRVTAVDNPRQSFILKPNEQIEYNHYTKAFEKRAVDASIATGWTKGELNFVNCSLKDILDALQRHYNVRIIVDFALKSSDLYTIKLKKGETLPNAIQIVTLTIGGINAQFSDDNSVVLTLSNLSVKKGGDPI